MAFKLIVVLLLAKVFYAAVIMADFSNMKTRYFGPPPHSVLGEHWMQAAAREMRKRNQGCPGEKYLGMEDGRIPDTSITASSHYINGGVNHGSHRARLNIEGRPAAWCKGKNDANPWIQVEFNAAVFITGLVTQSRGQDDWGHQRVTAYQVAYSSDGQNWTQVPNPIGNAAVFPGNVEEGNVTNWFETLRTRFLRILPTACEYHCCMRFEILGCYPCM